MESLSGRMDHLQMAIGRSENRQVQRMNPEDLRDAEFSVFSQGGADGLLQHLLRHVTVSHPIFVEFGVGDYRESNTRFLAVNNHWSGLLLEADASAVAAIRQDPIYWQRNLKAAQAFITRDTIDGLLVQHGMKGPIGVLSIDVDGNDYWIWDTIHSVTPAIVIVEYNHRFGPERAVSIPYDPEFRRDRAHPSMIYYGASLAALAALGRRKGYALVGCTRLGNDAFFVRKELLSLPLRERTPADAFVASPCRESRDAAGALAYLSPEEEQKILAGLPLVDVTLL